MTVTAHFQHHNTNQLTTTNMSQTTILLPGEPVPTDALPTSKKGTLTLGPGLRHIPPTSITATTLGSVSVDNKKSAVWLEGTNGRYQPSTGDLVIAQVHHSSTDVFHCALTPQTPHALLGQLAFEGASKKTRPQLVSGDLVYARVSRAVKGEDVELEGFNSATGKSEGMGQLKGGMVFEVSPAFARRLMMGKKGGVMILEGVGEKIRFEVAVGRNGRVWVDSGNVKTTASIGKLLTDSDEKSWSEEDQEKALKKALKDMS
jgi:exosome complex component RRP40